MYYISQETYDLLSDDLRSKVDEDTRKYKETSGDEMPFESEDAEKEKGVCPECGGKHSLDDEENKETPKTWDDAHKKGMALIIAVGKKKGGNASDD